MKQFQKNGNTDWDAVIDAGRAAMVGFFMAYLVDSLTGVGLVDQMSNFFYKTLLFIAVAGVLLIRKNENVETLKKLWEETTFYDKQLGRMRIQVTSKKISGVSVFHVSTRKVREHKVRDLAPLKGEITLEGKVMING